MLQAIAKRKRYTIYCHTVSQQLTLWRSLSHSISSAKGFDHEDFKIARFLNAEGGFI